MAMKRDEQILERKIQEVERSIPEKIDPCQFEPISSEDLIEILGLTIKKDEANKLIAFLCLLSAYTEDSQFNISFIAPSSTGKSYIPLEIARLFPKEDVKEMAYCSPTAFFHDVGQYSTERKGYIVDLSRKILIFLDQPHAQLLERLRPLLSHDKKELTLKITDKTQKHGLKTKNVFLRGYPAVVFCTTGLTIDEQEATRFLLLSPEVNEEKIRQAIHEKIKKETGPDAYQAQLDENPGRSLLKQRILAIKQACVKGIEIDSPEKITRMFFTMNKILRPRHTRDIGRIMSLTKSIALLNLSHRKRDGSTLVATDEDVEEAFRVWDTISESQELDLPPFVYGLYKEVIIVAWNEKTGRVTEGFVEIPQAIGLTRQDIIRKHCEVYRRPLPDWQLRQQVLPMLESAGLITQEPDPTDRRRVLICPATPASTSGPVQI
ncbi:MAG: hypothetical protein QME66_12715 [Candidatus Eisenbacteria bacterium]|nr:hypothetical protein [Candidatus Eisenbacteria bacterium]